MKASTTKRQSNQRRTKFSPTSRPEGYTLEEWQEGLRKQAAEQSIFFIVSKPIASPFGIYEVSNPASGYTHQLYFYGANSPRNLCSCLDFKTNCLNTCKHLEWIKQQLEQKIGSTNQTHLPSDSGLFLSYGEERAVVLHIGAEQSEEIRRLSNDYFDEQFHLTEYGLSHIDRFIRQIRTVSPSFVCHEDAIKFVVEKREQAARSTLFQQKYSDGKLSNLLKTTLYPYQEKGILFAALKGKSIIADEMGLGKTIQAIGAAELIKKEFGIVSVLVVCPTSLKYQWKKEIERFTDSTVHIVEGLHYQRKEQYKQPEFYKIVSYNSLANDLKILKSMTFDMVIMDEAQRLKNWNTQIAKATKRLRSDYTVILSGTPLENKIEELYSLTQYIDPYCLGPYYRLMDSTRIINETGKTIGYKNLNNLAKRLDRILIRRQKKEVEIELPERIDQLLFVPLTSEQKEIHETANAAVARLVKKWSQLKFLTEKDRQMLLNNLSIMRMVSDSTFLIDQKSRHDTKITELSQILNVYIDNNGAKAVIFSQWERMTRLVVEELERKGIGFQYLHGGIPSIKRKDIVEQFSQDPECKVFVSTDAGCTGLNLQAASLLINMDLPWNPAVLEQRIARIHRIGQRRNIQVINFVSTDSIEERMLSLLDFKTALFDGILNDGADSIFLEKKQFDQLIEVLEPMVESNVAHPSNRLPIQEQEEQEKTQSLTKSPKENLKQMLYDDESDNELIASNEKKNESSIDANELVRQGVSFLSSLAATLSSPEKTKQLIDNLIEEDVQTGETFLKISVPNKESVASMFRILGKIIK